MPYHHSKRCYRVITATLAAGLPILATAQETSPRMLEEVVVTAQKRSESLDDVPISIAVMNNEALLKTGVRQMREIAEFVPNVSMTAGNDQNSAIRIRGVGAVTRNIGFDTRVGTYLDGVYLGQSPSQNIDIVDLERVEILRGPQGTLFGKNTVAGAINFITRKPQDEFSAELRGEAGNYNSHRVEGVVNLPVTDSLATRWSVVDHHRDGYVDNLTTGTEHNERDSTTLRGELRWRSERLDFSLAGDYMESERVSFFGEAITDWSGTVSPDPLAPDRLEISNNIDNYEDKQVWGLAATLDLTLGAGYSLKSITAYRDTDIRRIQDSDHSAVDLLVVDYPDQYGQWSQEFQLFSPDADRLSYVAGLYFYRQKADTERAPEAGGDLSVLLEAQGSPLAPLGPLFEGAGAGTYGEVDTDSWAAYINGTYDISERLTLGFGARYTWEEKSINYAIIGDIVDIGIAQIPAAAIFGVAVGPVVDGKTVAAYKDDNEYTDFSPTVNLNYALTDDINLYIKYASAFKSGGYNADFVSQTAYETGIDFDTETVDAWEAGIKGTLLDNRVRFSLVGFQMEFEDYQVNQFVDLGNNLSAITIRNAAEVTSRGIEGELTWYATDQLMLQGSVGTNDAEFDQFEGGGSSRNPGGLGADLSGNSLPGAPDLSAAFSAQYNYPLDRWAADLVTRLDWTYSDGYYTSVDNISVANPGSDVPFGEVDSYQVLNGRIGIESPEGWSAYLWARNMLDEEYSQVSESDFFGTILDFPADPRTYGIELAYRWD